MPVVERIEREQMFEAASFCHWKAERDFGKKRPAAERSDQPPDENSISISRSQLGKEALKQKKYNFFPRGTYALLD